MSNQDLTDEDIELAHQKFQGRQNSEGNVKPEDVEHVLRDCGIVIQKFHLAEQIKGEEQTINANNGFVDIEIFTKIYKRTFLEQLDENGLLNALKSLIPLGDKAVPAADMREILMTYGDKLTPEEADEFIADCDAFGTGELDPETVTNVLTTQP